jgi:hypothetical protein
LQNGRFIKFHRKNLTLKNCLKLMTVPTMNKSELISRLSDLEWEDFEVKEASANIPKDTWETISSFANTSGGWIVFGIKQLGNNSKLKG